MTPILDALRRPLGTLRLSVTDRCNLRCHYCMPSRDYQWLRHSDVLSFEELSRLADVFGELGATYIRLTGGEPLIRRDLPSLVRLLAARPWLRDLALTTNGALLPDLADDLKRSGLHRLTVSLDTLRRDRFQRLARTDALPRVLAGIDAARRAGFDAIKLNAVVTRGDNDDELVDLIEFARKVGAEIRFIEYMRVGAATDWRPAKVVSRREMLARLEERYGPIVPMADRASAPAARFRLPDGLTFGIVSATSQPFCRACTRARVTADGVLFLCLHAQRGLALGRALRAGASHDALVRLLRQAWEGRTDRGAESQLAERRAGARTAPGRPAPDSRVEMHALGG